MAINVVISSNLGQTIKAAAIAAGKYDVNIDGTTITADGSGVLSADQSKVDALIALSGLPSLSTTLGAFTGSTIPDGQTVKQALQALETSFEALNIVGQFAGSAATFAGLPTTTSDGKPVNNSDWAVLTIDDGANEAGIYVWNGTTYVLVAEIPDQFAAAATAISPASNDATGAVGTQSRYAREDHKHPAQAVSTDATNLLSNGSDGRNRLLPAAITGLATIDVQDAFGVHLGYMFP